MIDTSFQELETVTLPEERGVTEIFQSPLVDDLSSAPVTEWHKLISQTNWEKGRIILEWRQSLVAAELPETAYSDDAWAMRVRGVSSNSTLTAQHVGRLRRVFERFGETRDKFAGLYWSHFQAALGWEDAEMWLEGAVQNSWSVMQMKSQRWEAVGAPADLKPRESDIMVTELDEDANPRNDSDFVPGSGNAGAADTADRTKIKSKKNDADTITSEVISETNNEPPIGEVLQNMKSLDELPTDLQEAFEQLKVAILNHKVTNFKEVDPQRIIHFLNTMKQVVLSSD
jgi:hypothetical protein